MVRDISEEYLTTNKGCILCYSGSKARYLKELYDVLPEERNLKVLDAFAGGGSLCTNLPEDYIVTANDSEHRVVDIHQELGTLLSYCSAEELETYVKEFCHNWVKNRQDADGYYELKDHYNTGIKGEDSVDPLLLFALTMSSNTNYIRFNKYGEQTLQFGKRFYNSNSSKKMLNYLNRISTRDITWKSKDFRDYNFSDYDLSFIDPPYAFNGKSTATYNEQGKWQLQDLVCLLSKLDKAHAEGSKWVFFNEIITKGKDNPVIQNWVNKYNVKILRDTLSGCSYQRTKDRSVEVMVTNY